MVKVLLDRLTPSETPPTEEADALRNLIRARCEQDGWSADATRCLIAMKTLDDAGPCAGHMTDEQQAALVRDQQAQLGGTPGAVPAAAPGPRTAAPR